MPRPTPRRAARRVLRRRAPRVRPPARLAPRARLHARRARGRPRHPVRRDGRLRRGRDPRGQPARGARRRHGLRDDAVLDRRARCTGWCDRTARSASTAGTPRSSSSSSTSSGPPASTGRGRVGRPRAAWPGRPALPGPRLRSCERRRMLRPDSVDAQSRRNSPRRILRHSGGSPMRRESVRAADPARIAATNRLRNDHDSPGMRRNSAPRQLRVMCHSWPEELCISSSTTWTAPSSRSARARPSSSRSTASPTRSTSPTTTPPRCATRSRRTSPRRGRSRRRAPRAAPAAASQAPAHRAAGLQRDPRVGEGRTATQVSERGRVPASVLEAYEAAH